MSSIIEAGSTVTYEGKECVVSMDTCTEAKTIPLLLNGKPGIYYVNMSDVVLTNVKLQDFQGKQQI